MELLSAKCIKDPEAFSQLQDYVEQKKIREEEVANIIQFIDNHPEIYEEPSTPPSRPVVMVPDTPDSDLEVVEITEDEAREEDAKWVLNKLIKNLEKKF